MTARRIIAKGCVHPPKGPEPRPLAASVRLVRAPAPVPVQSRPFAETSVKRWATKDR